MKTALRLPPDLHGELHAAAAEAERGFNAEILFRLRQSFKGRKKGLPNISKNSLQSDSTNQPDLAPSMQPFTHQSTTNEGQKP
ncbi:Arc family DNA-binding protein [Pseudorhodoferax sp. LjRoot39]|uniref:Arc family DNA-binding protein n=1 Tax=Pseudorhodoferax sp. LjRoot39 TaxID=3342328 RepID=UPI003ED146F0